MLTQEQLSDRKKLLKAGKELFAIVGNELNILSTRSKENYRRKEDHEEICIAMALLMETMGINVENRR